MAQAPLFRRRQGGSEQERRSYSMIVPQAPMPTRKKRKEATDHPPLYDLNQSDMMSAATSDIPADSGGSTTLTGGVAFSTSV